MKSHSTFRRSTRRGARRSTTASRPSCAKRGSALRRRIVDYLSRWTRPALVAAAVIALVSGIPLLRQNAPPVGGTTAEILGVPPGFVAIARSTQAPGVIDLAEALGVEASHGR